MIDKHEHKNGTTIFAKDNNTARDIDNHIEVELGSFNKYVLALAVKFSRSRSSTEYVSLDTPIKMMFRRGFDEIRNNVAITFFLIPRGKFIGHNF
jgi:hypothetical protein